MLYQVNETATATLRLVDSQTCDLAARTDSAYSASYYLESKFDKHGDGVA